MGYRSDVTIICEEKAYELFKEAWNKFDIKPDCVKKTDDEYIIEWNYIKWYRDFEDVGGIERVCSRLCRDEYDEKEGYAFKMFVIGEDYRTDEEANSRGWDIDYYIRCFVDIPESAKEIEF